MRHLVAATVALLLAGPAAAQEGKVPKEINAKGWLNSEAVSLEKLKGKVVVVEFWATWCPPCRASIPHLNDLRAKHDKSKVEIIGLTDEPLSKIEQFAKDLKMSYTVGYGSTSGDAYGVNGIPHAFVIGPDGTIKWDGHPMDDAMGPMIAKLAETVKVKPATPVASPDPKPAMAEALAAASKSGSLPSGFKVAWSRSDAGKKSPREFTLTGAEFELRTDKGDVKTGKLEDKEAADLLKALADTQIAIKEAKPPAKASVRLAVTVGEDSRELAFDPVKGYGALGKAVKAVEDLHAKYAK